MKNLSMFLLVFLLGCGATKDEIQKKASATAPASHEELKDGIVAVIALDTSGSMTGSVANAQGTNEEKLAIAKRCVLNLVKEFETYAKQHPEKNVQLGIISFASSPREILAIGAPDLTRATAVVNQLGTSGGTAIGEAMLYAKSRADNMRLSKVHILTITDGENVSGADPATVTEVFNKQAVPPSTYLIGFSVSSSAFENVKKAGGMVLSANNEADLAQTINFVLSKKILLELPE